MKYTDDILERKIADLQKLIVDWATSHDLWTDSGFTTYEEEYDEEPNKYGACVTVMYTEGGLFSVLNGYSGWELYDELNALLDTTDFYIEAHNHYLFNFYCKDDELNEAYLQYFRWRWILKVTEPEYTSLHQEIFEYFNKHPEKLHLLHWRKYEILISEIFRNQGFQTLLGTGRNDGGVDLRLFQKGEIDPIVTLVQVKHYKPDSPIGLEAVAALTGCVHTEGANNGLFITSSRYLPSARSFAARQNSKIRLADGQDVVSWCGTVHNILASDRSKLFTDEYLRTITKTTFPDLRGKIFVANAGFNMVRNEFAIVLKDSEKVVLMMIIPGFQIPSSDGNVYTTGYEVARTDDDILQYRREEFIFRGRKVISPEGKVNILGNNNSYQVWNGEPLAYDWND